MKGRSEVLGTLTLLTIKNIITILQDSTLKTVFSVLFFLKCIKKKHFRSTQAEQFI